MKCLLLSIERALETVNYTPHGMGLSFICVCITLVMIRYNMQDCSVYLTQGQRVLSLQLKKA